MKVKVMEESYERLKGLIDERRKTMEMYYSKLEVLKQLEKEIKGLLEQVEAFDKKITIWTPLNKQKERRQY